MTNLCQSRLVKLLPRHAQWCIFNNNPSQLESISKRWLIEPYGSTLCILYGSPLQLFLHAVTGPFDTCDEVEVMVYPRRRSKLLLLDICGRVAFAGASPTFVLLNTFEGTCPC
jgi:hypothetical protein